MKKIISLALILVSVLAISLLTGCNEQEKKIKVYTRDTSSGTRDGFFTTIGFSEAKANDALLVSGYNLTDSNGSMITSIKNDEYGIGYISISSLSSDLKALTYENVVPSEENVLNGTYKLTRNYNYIVRSEFDTEDEKDIVLAFQAYLQTKDAKTTMQSKDGILSIASSDKSWDDIKANYPITLKDNSNITIKFGGSTSVEKMAKALSSEFALKCGNFKTEHIHTGSSDAYKRTQGSEKDGVNKLHVAFASRKFSSSEVSKEGTTGKMCTDAIVVVVNKANSVTKVTADILKKIYNGTITTWSEIE